MVEGLGPIPPQQFVEARVCMITDAAKHVGQPNFGIDVVELGGGDQGIHGKAMQQFFCSAPRGRGIPVGGGPTWILVR